MEFQEAAEKAHEKTRAADVGKALDPNHLAAKSYPPKWEAKAFAFPVFPRYSKTIQNPDGTFKFMAGFDGAGTTPL